MNPTGYTKIILSCLMAAVVVISVLVPVVYSSSMTTTTISNEGAGWAKYAYYDEATDYDIDLSSDGSTLTMGAQSGTASDMIVYASDVFSVLYAGDSFQLVAPSGSSADLGASASVASSSGTVTVTDSSNAAVYSSDAVSWAYVPDSAGVFGFFDDVGAKLGDFPLAAAGSFESVYVYNTYSTAGELVINHEITDNALASIEWAPIEATGDIPTFSKGTGSYVDGNWTFGIIDSSTANLINYAGTTGEDVDLIIPSTVTDGTNTYTVTSIGSGAASYNFVNSNGAKFKSITMPDTLEIIGSGAFKKIYNSGPWIIPDSVKFIHNAAFENSRVCDQIIIPSSVLKIGNTVFNNVEFYYDSSYVPGYVAILGDPILGTSALSVTVPSNTPIEILYMGDSEISTSATVTDSIPLIGYMAPVSYSEDIQNEGLEYDIMAYIPALMLVGLMLGVVGVVMNNRRA